MSTQPNPAPTLSGTQNAPTQELAELYKSPAPTPRTDDVAAKIDALACQWRTGQIDAVQYEEATRLEMDRLRTLERELTSAQAALAAKDAEIARLKANAVFTEPLLDVHAICDQRDKAVAERDQLRAEAEILKQSHAAIYLALGSQQADHTQWPQEIKQLRAEKAEAELARCNDLCSNEHGGTVSQSLAATITQLRADLAAAKNTLREYLPQLAHEWDWKRNSTPANNREMAELDAAIDAARKTQS